jgi:hypothetical protein
MIRAVMFLAIVCAPRAVFGQVPPGFPYEEGKHPNPILTYVTEVNFKPSTYAEAQEMSGLELLGLSQQEGRRDFVEVAAVPATTRKVRILRQGVDVIFYPVVRQTFRLAGGSRLILHSFKFPRLPVSLEEAARALDETAFERSNRPAESRFGLAPRPEKLEIRGRAALLFEHGDRRTVFWVERGIVHTATGVVPAQDLFAVIEDLL